MMSARPITSDNVFIQIISHQVFKKLDIKEKKKHHIIQTLE